MEARQPQEKIRTPPLVRANAFCVPKLVLKREGSNTYRPRGLITPTKQVNADTVGVTTPATIQADIQQEIDKLQNQNHLSDDYWKK